MKLSDYVFLYFKEMGVQHVFTLTGGGIMHLIDSLGRSGMEYVCCHHEQAAAIAAQAYSMYDEGLNICLVTTGPGGTNALTGVAAAYVDSTPVIYLSGQVKRSDFASLRGVRQFGAQENDIIAMAAPVTKYAVTVMNPEDIAYELEKSVYLATQGRKGPVWIDIPLDVQAAEIDEKHLRHYIPEETAVKPDYIQAADDTLRLLKKSKRPVLLVGQGMKSSGAGQELYTFIEKTGIPVLATWRALDFMDSEEEGFFGSPGLQAPRYSNLILQTCDCLIVLGSRMDNMITAFNEEHFAYRAKKVIVDIDEFEIKKLAMTEIYPVVGDVREYMTALLARLEGWQLPDYTLWMEKCRIVKKRFPILSEKQDMEEKVNLYQVTEEISRYAREDDTIVISSTSRCNTAGHIAFSHKRGQKTISSMGMGSMGFALPSAVGAYYASGRNRVIVIEGDGSLQLNIQELETIVSHGIDAKMFIFNNTGYAAITTMQDRNFESFYVGSNEKSGLFMPDLEKIAYAYGIPYERIDKTEDIADVVSRVMAMEGPVMCDITGSLWFDEIPKCISSVDKESGRRVSAFLENPYPYLPKEELEEVEHKLMEE
ncbi:MAG: thiamine pyrophosphate-binding protein [Lachnospiraceae bacterium]|nr:thiamine pyrophosphate-binding protein [Lachnospiraceae bacterium]